MSPSLRRDFSLSAVIAGFVTVLVGFTSSGIIVFEAAHALGATTAQSNSWLWALGLGMGFTSFGLSLRYRTPIATAWSTAGAVLLINAAPHLSLAEAVGAFVISGLLITLAGFSGLFERLMRRIPVALASAMLAGILLRFGLNAFSHLQTHFALTLSMLLAYLLVRHWQPRYAVIASLVTGIISAQQQGLFQLHAIPLQLAYPEWVTPQFSLHASIGVAIPLFIVTMASQNLAGVAAIRQAGFQPPISPIIGWTGVFNALFAPFGAFTINLAAITAAISLGREAHEHPHRRYIAAMSAGVFYLLLGIFGATIGAVFAAFPQPLVLTLAGLALLGTIGNGLATALQHEHQREPALITFLVTASGITLWGVGAAFWGLCAGLLALLIQRLPRFSVPKSTVPSSTSRS